MNNFYYNSWNSFLYVQVLAATDFIRPGSMETFQDMLVEEEYMYMWSAVNRRGIYMYINVGHFGSLL